MADLNDADQDIDDPNAPEPPMPLPPEGYGSFDFWQKQIQADEAYRDDNFKPTWDKNIASYLAKSRNQLNSALDSGDITVPKDFANVEQKRAQLFFQLPKITCRALRPAWQQVTPLAQAVLRFYLGPARLDSMKLMREVLFDALCPSGLMISKIGYQATSDGTQPMQIPDPNAPPIPQPGNILNIGPQPPAMQTVQVPRIVAEQYFWERISAGKAIIPRFFVGSNYDKAPYLGHRFRMPSPIAARTFNVDEDDLKPSTADDEKKLKGAPAPSGEGELQEVEGVELFYQAAMFDPNEKNPDKFRQLVILDGMDAPVVHRDSPYQKFDPQTGKLTVGMRGNPIHIGALRYVSDTCYPPSECTIGRTLVDELGKFRTQSSLLRDRAVSVMLYDEVRLGGAANAEKIRRGILAGWVPVPGLDASNPPILEAQKAHMNQDNYRGNDYIDRDLSEVWSFGPNQRGEEAQESRTATEMKIAQNASSARIGTERQQAVEYFMKGGMKVWSLLQMFANQEEWVEIIGQDGLQQMQAWDKQRIAGEYVFEADPDSAAQVDWTQKKKDDLQLYELTAKDPNANRVELLTQIMIDYGYDPARSVVTQLPPKGPHPAQISFTIKGEELDSTRPEFPLLLSILQQAGYQIPPDVMQQIQQHRQIQSALMAHAGLPPGAGIVAAGAGAGKPTNGGGAMVGPQEHGGAAAKLEGLKKHQERLTGGTPNDQHVGVQ